MSRHDRAMERLDALLAGFAAQEPLPGLAVGIVAPDGVFARGYGIRDAGTGEPVDEHTLFHLASVSKPLVATAVMQLAEQGRLNLDAPASDCVPYFKLADGREREVTIRDLLSHTSGMPDEEDFQWDSPEDDEGSLERYVRALAARSLDRNPGEEHAYSNIGFELLGDVIAKVSGMSFEAYMREHVLRPAGMEESTFLLAEVPASQLAAPHILGAPEGRYGPQKSLVFPYHRAHGPSSTLYMNAVDSCRLMLAYLKPEQAAEGKGLLEEGSQGEMWSTRVGLGYGDWLDGIALGWFTGAYRGRRAVSHTGQDTGFRSYLVLLPEAGLGVTLMMNDDYVGLKVLMKGILDLLLGEGTGEVQRNLAHYLTGIALSGGIDAAWDEYRQILHDGVERYAVSADDFSYIAYPLEENGYAGEALQVLELGLRLFPESEHLRERLRDSVQKMNP